MEDYKVMDNFLYNLTEEDFTDKWAQGISPTVKVGLCSNYHSQCFRGHVSIKDSCRTQVSLRLCEHWILETKFVIKKCEFMLPSGLGQGKLVAINLFNIVKPFSLGGFFFCLFSILGCFEILARSQSARFSLCLNLNEHFQDRNTHRVFIRLGRNLNPYYYCSSSPSILLLVLLFQLWPDCPSSSVSSQTIYKASKSCSAWEALLLWHVLGPLCLQPEWVSAEC